MCNREIRPLRTRRALIGCVGIGVLIASDAVADAPPMFPTLTMDCIVEAEASRTPDFRACVTLSAYACAERNALLICLGQEYEVWDAAVKARLAGIRSYAAEYEAEWPMLAEFESANAAWADDLTASCGFAGRLMLGGSGEQPEEAFCALHLMADRMNYFDRLGI